MVQASGDGYCKALVTLRKEYKSGNNETEYSTIGAEIGLCAFERTRKYHNCTSKANERVKQKYSP